MKQRHISFGTGKKTMVIVPGLTIGYVTDSAQAIERAFSAFAEDYTVHLFDVRDDVPDGYSIRDMGEELIGSISALGADGVCLYGCSLGAMACLYAAGTAPALVRRAVIAASACRASEMSEAVIGRWIALAAAGRRRELGEDMGRMIYSPAAFASVGGALAEAADCAAPEALIRFIRTASVMSGLELTEETAAIRCPVLVLGSRGDRVLGAAASRQIAALCGGELYLYGEEYPHAVYDEAPDFLPRVKCFFDRA